MLYQITFYTPNPYDRCHDATRQHIVGSLPAARKLAASLLKPHARFETTYSAQTTRAPYVEITKACRFISDHMFRQGQPKEYRAMVGTIETVEPTLTYVPSVGDLGYGA